MGRMSETTQNSDAAAFVAHWARVGPILEQVRRDELRAQQHDHQHAEVIDALLAAGIAAGHRNQEKRTERCGFFAMRRLFDKANHERSL